MKGLAFITLLLLLTTPVLSQDWMRYTRYIGDKKYEVNVVEKDLEEMPNWNPETDPVPITIRDVTQTARTNLKRLAPESLYASYSLDEVNLFKLRDKWFYQVSFKSLDLLFGDDDSGEFSIFVKMDGSILEPKVTSWNRKSDNRIY